MVPFEELAAVKALRSKRSRAKQEAAHELIHELVGALEVASLLIRDAEKDTNWVSGDPYGESAAAEFERLIVKARNHDAH